MNKQTNKRTNKPFNRPINKTNRIRTCVQYANGQNASYIEMTIMAISAIRSNAVVLCICENLPKKRMACYMCFILFYFCSLYRHYLSSASGSTYLHSQNSGELKTIRATHLHGEVVDKLINSLLEHLNRQHFENVSIIFNSQPNKCNSWCKCTVIAGNYTN